MIKKDALGSTKGIFNNGTSNTNGWGFQIGSLNIRSAYFGSSFASTTATDITTSAEIISLTYAGGTAGAVTLYSDGSSKNLTTSTMTATAPTRTVTIGSRLIGGGISWQGYISEIIVYDSALNDKKRRDIESYLSKNMLSRSPNNKLIKILCFA